MIIRPRGRPIKGKTALGLWHVGVASGPFAKLPAKRVSFMTLTFSHIASGLTCQPPSIRRWRTLRRSDGGLGFVA